MAFHNLMTEARCELMRADSFGSRCAPGRYLRSNTLVPGVFPGATCELNPLVPGAPEKLARASCELIPLVPGVFPGAICEINPWVLGVFQGATCELNILVSGASFCLRAVLAHTPAHTLQPRELCIKAGARGHLDTFAETPKRS